MSRKVQRGPGRSIRFYFFLNIVFSTTHRAGFGAGNSIARVTRFCGLQLETINHGILLGK
jgi:hypothetical protein